jgi:hypothetical protein
LLETLSLRPKKKHFKKVVNHMIEFEDKNNVDYELMNHIIRIGVQEKWPVTLGRVMKHFISNDYNITTK